MGTVRVALIGCGDHGRHGHLEGYRRLIEEGEDVRLAAVCDRDEERARLAAEAMPGARPYVDYRAMLANEHPDAVSVATPAAFHRDHVLAALRGGAHVLCEKPLAMNLAEAREMVAAADELNRILTMGLEHRYVPASGYLRSALASGALGRVYHTRLWCGHIWRLPPSPHFLQRSLAGGGVIASTAVHWLDLALWILGNPEVDSVSAATFAKAPRLDAPPPPFQEAPEGARILAADDVEDFAAGFLRFADGSSLSFEANWLQHPTRRRIGIQFLAERGVAEHRPLAVRRDADAQVVDRTPPDVPSEHADHYFVDVVRDFVRAARSGGKTIIRGPEMLQVQGIVDALYESARCQREIPLSSA